MEEGPEEDAGVWVGVVEYQLRCAQPRASRLSGGNTEGRPSRGVSPGYQTPTT